LQVYVNHNLLKETENKWDLLVRKVVGAQLSLIGLMDG